MNTDSITKIFETFGFKAEMFFAVILVICITDATKEFLKMLETHLEKKKGKEIVFFNHTKIVLVLIYSIIASVVLAFAKVITWNAVPLYSFFILGLSAFFYDIALKKLLKLLDE